MMRTKLLILAVIVSFTATGCGRHGGLAFLAGFGIAAAVAHVAAEAEEEQRERDAIDRIEAERAYAATHATELRAAPPGLPPGTVIIVPAPGPQ